MAESRTRADILNRDFLETRAKILEIASALDRLDRAPGDAPDPRRAKLQEGLDAVRSGEPGRAEAVQLIFSLDYDPEWQRRFELKPQRP